MLSRAKLGFVSSLTPRTVDPASCQAALAGCQVSASQGSHGAHNERRAHTASTRANTMQTLIGAVQVDLLKAALILYDLIAPVKGLATKYTVNCSYGDAAADMPHWAYVAEQISARWA